jgi:hypothetical protein
MKMASLSDERKKEFDSLSFEDLEYIIEKRGRDVSVCKSCLDIFWSQCGPNEQPCNGCGEFVVCSYCKYCEPCVIAGHRDSGKKVEPKYRPY